MSVQGRIDEAEATDFDRAAARLYGAIVGADPGGDYFPLRLRASLSSTLALLGEEPTIAHILLDHRGSASEAKVAARRAYWLGVFSSYLRQLGEEGRALVLPPEFAEPFLISGIRIKLEKSMRVREAADLTLSSLLEYTLLYYLQPAEVQQILGGSAWTSRQARGVPKGRQRNYHGAMGFRNR